MKTRTVLILLMIMSFGYAKAQQQDSVTVTKSEDTLKIGGIIILKKEKTTEGDDHEKTRVTVKIGQSGKSRKSNITTSTFFMDIGFANWIDNTNYAAATSGNVLVSRPGQSALGSKDFKLRTGKSVNVNLWLVGQKVNLVKHYFNLKYALGLELNNYRFKNAISFSEGGFNPYNHGQDISHAFVFQDSIRFTKNKLAADYITIPVMLNFTSNPDNLKRSVTLSGGISVGYLYSARNKQKSDERGKRKNNGDYDLEKWKFSYVGDLGIGPVHVYGSYSPNSIFKNDLNFQPFTVGLRLQNKW